MLSGIKVGHRMKCFKMVRVGGHDVRCPGVVGCHGLLSSGDTSYRVFSSDEHVGLLTDSLPTSVREMRTVPKDPEVGVRPPRKDSHWAVITDV